MNAPAKIRMKVPEFLEWAQRQPSGRYELVNGEVFAMAPEVVRHNLVKMATARALEDAVSNAELPCTVFTDGVTVVINDETTREPGASVQCGVDIDLDSLTLEAPLIVVEIISPSSAKADSTVKLIEYFSAASIQHYLVIDPIKKCVVHHQRAEAGVIHTRIHSAGELLLQPPGLTIPVTQFFGRI
jgi:Uma2 family endonuclease